MRFIPHLTEFALDEFGKKIFSTRWKNVYDSTFKKLGPFKTRKYALEKCRMLYKTGDGKIVIYKNYDATMDYSYISKKTFIVAEMECHKFDCDELYGLNCDKSIAIQLNLKASEQYLLHNSKTWYDKSTIDDYFDANNFVSYTKIVNDKEEAILGIDQYRQIEGADDRIDWILDKAVTSKVTKYSKLNSFLRKKYESQINDVIPQLYNGKNSFNFNSKANACLGYCVEYYAKYLVYGEKYLRMQIEKAKAESNVNVVNDFVIIRACMLKYKENMVRAYGAIIAKSIRTISVEQLIKKDYTEFVKTVVELGTRTAEFIKKEFNISNDKKVIMYDPNLSTNHISALCDFITKDKIVDIKCTSNITMHYVLQVLAYHYLSTKRDDVDIKELIVFDAAKNKCVRIKV